MSLFSPRARRRVSTLRQQTLSAMAMALLGLLAVLTLISSRVFLSGYTRLENEATLRNLERAQEALAAEMKAFRQYTLDWAFWDDTYEFIVHPTGDYIQKNLIVETFANAQFHCAVFVRPTGEVVWGAAYDPAGRTLTPLPPGLTDHLVAGSSLLSPAHTNGLVGLLSLPDGVMMVVCGPILTSEKHGPARGSLLFGRWLDKGVLERLAKIVIHPVEVQRVDPRGMPRDFRNAFHALPGGLGSHLQVKGLRSILGYLGLPDVYGKPVLLLRVTFPRFIFRQGLRSLSLLIGGVLAAGLVFSVVLLSLLGKKVHRPLWRLVESIRQIQQRPDLAQRLPVEGSNELAVMAESLNAMLAALEQANTMRDQAEKARQQADRLYRMLFAEMASGFALHEIVCDDRGVPRDYRFLDVNPAFERLTGLRKEQVLGRTVREVLPNVESLWIERYGRVALTGQPDAFEYFSRDLGRRYEVQAFSPQQGRFAVIFNDVTEKKRREEELAQIQKLESLGVLAGGLAHDFNNLLTVILGNLHLTRLQLPAADKETIEILNEAESAALQATHLSQQLLTFAKGGAPMKRVCDLGPILRDAAPFALHGSNVRLKLEIAEDVWPVEADPSQINQVIQNLVLNAVQAMPSGGDVMLRAHNAHPDQVRPPLSSSSRYVVIEVVDTGVGIPAKHWDRIFDPYFTTKQKGSGLGLAISLSIVRKHGGTITVDSRLGEGSTFRVFLPATDKSPADSSKPDLQKLRRGSERILLVDDEEAIRRVVVRMLTRLGYDVTAVATGEEGLRLFSEALQAGRPFTLAVLDLTLPGGMNGLQILQGLQKIRPDVRAIVSSGYASDPIMATYREHGFAGVVTKPFRLAELARAVEQALTSSRES